MLVPGTWWQNVEKEDADKMYECVITDVICTRMGEWISTRYEFEIEWVGERGNTYTMLWPDVQRWVYVTNPTLTN